MLPPFTCKTEYLNFSKIINSASMSLQMQSHSLLSFNFNKSQILTKIHPTSLSRTPFTIRVRSSTTSPPINPLSSPSLVASILPTPISINLGFRPTPELGLFSHLLVLSMAFGAFFSVAVISIPTLMAFGRLGASVKKLSNVVSEEVPGTLASLNLSSLELKDLTQQLSSLRS
ncbi:uncharacterized protein [Cicer arietinum]|uniref:Uncharacterized protein LOC101497792 isoform X2 n=1 Tax=Cicer arietinum TaxID=3827 RepID=A0A1S3EFB4_CICAR|nr:uncharacterized protein LOC101497792 isoform X2 [Cicer arietinum]XP_012574527.1 uncharacterized protein LOC101497792 isoform X2 [Cicer arietinum]XP_012574529.1 uncharacterized protein LOC101497792 isoform X2 [Cicer arietinum]